METNLHLPTTRRARRGARIAAVALASTLVLTACGDDDDATSDADGSAELRAEVEGDTDTEGPGSVDEAFEGTAELSLEELAFAAARGLDAESHEVTGETSVTFVLTGGTADNPRVECVGAGVVLPADTEITLVFPDGEVVCD